MPPLSAAFPSLHHFPTPPIVFSPPPHNWLVLKSLESASGGTQKQTNKHTKHWILYWPETLWSASNLRSHFAKLEIKLLALEIYFLHFIHSMTFTFPGTDQFLGLQRWIEWFMQIDQIEVYPRYKYCTKNRGTTFFNRCQKVSWEDRILCWTRKPSRSWADRPGGRDLQAGGTAGIEAGKHETSRCIKEMVGNLVWLDTRGETGDSIFLGKGIWTYSHRIYFEKKLFGRNGHDGLE